MKTPHSARVVRRVLSPATTRATAVALAVVLSSGLAGCSGDDDKQEKPSAAASPSPVTTQTSVAALTGRLTPDAQEQLTAAVTKVVDDWFDAAFLGDFPRSDYAPAFGAFTDGAATKARQHLDLLTGAAIADRIDHAEATARTVGLDVLAVKGKPVGVTATVDLAFATTGTLAGPQRVTGTLDLTPVDGQWRVFGFDIASTTATAAAPAAPASTTATTEETP